MPTSASRSAAEILARMVQDYTGAPTAAADMQPVAAGASGRSIMRARGVLGIHWTAARADNNDFLPAARELAAADIRVPAVLAEQELGGGCGACLVQDLGTRDILSLKHAPWAERKAAYTEALRTLRPLYDTFRPQREMQPPFDAALYRWEQAYFAEHFIGRHLGGDAAAFLAHPALQDMAEWLGSLPRVPVHRDCQSQNIMLAGGHAWLIDFQGMRYGREEYDLASLLCDPYMELSAAERAELLEVRASLGAPALSPDIYTACALQRLMQALGAFANIGHNQGKTWYLGRIPAALAALREVADNAPDTTPLAPAAAWIRQHITM